MNALSQWLQLMLAEIARKQDESERARDEETRRAARGRCHIGAARARRSARRVDKFSTS